MQTSDLYSLVYVSSAVTMFDDSALQEILVKSRQKNTAVGITGMLLYKDGNFIQAVEGPEANVLALQRTIAADPRHRGFTTLLRGPVAERSFSDWSMGFKNLSGMEDDQLAGYSTLLQARSLPKAFQSQPSKAHRLLLTFRNNMR